MICCRCELHGLGWSQRTLDVVGFFSFLRLAEGNGTHARPQSAIENLANIQQSLETKRTTARELREQLKQQEDVSEKQALEQKIERTNKDITSLQLAFENIALGNPDLSVLTDEPVEQIDWRVELERVSRPLLSTLKELTAKPRHIDSLRRESARLQDQLKVIQKAIDSIYHFKQQTLPPMAAAPIDQLLIDREQRKDDVEHALEITHFKLAVIKTESTAWYTSAGAALTLRQTLPRYAAELRLLLGVGPVREKERLVLDGVPFVVESLSVYTILNSKPPVPAHWTTRYT